MEFFQLAATYKLSSAWVFLVTVDILLGVTKCASQEEVQQHLSIGGELVARGQLQDALPHFHAAVEADPKNYMCYFKRGTVHLALGKAKNAVNDFNRVLELKPGFTGARNYRAMVLMKQGLLDQAKEDFLYIYQQENNGEAYSNYVKAQNLKSDIALVEAQIHSNDNAAAVETLTLLIESCPWSSYLRELRSQCYVALDNPLAAILDLKSTTKLTPDNTDGLFKLAILYYQLGQAAESLKESRACLKLDPDHKDCFPHYKKVKKIDKFLSDAQSSLDSEQYEDCINSLQKVLKTEEKVPMIRFVTYSKLGSCYLKNNQPFDSVEACTKALDISRDPEILCNRAEAYIDLDMFEEAMKDYHEVLDGHEGYPRAKEGIQRAQKLQKQSEKRDYYKILGVKRSATKKEITKAYRKMAQQWHPDNFPDGNEKKKAEKKFIDIAAAKEVLTNEEKRAKFDKGDDPLDPESGNHEGFNPFQQFHMFHGEPFTVRFNFH